MEKKWKTNSSIQIYLPHFQTTLWVDLDHVYTLRINAVSKRFLLWIGLVSTLLWCYPQHKSVQFFSTQNGRAEQFLNAFHKVQTTQNRTRKWESFIVFYTTSIFLSVQLKFAFLLPFWLPLRSLIFFLSQLTPWYVSGLLKLFHIDPCRQFIPEHCTGSVDKSLGSNNILKQNLSAKCEH